MNTSIALHQIMDTPEPARIPPKQAMTVMLRVVIGVVIIVAIIVGIYMYLGSNNNNTNSLPNMNIAGSNNLNSLVNQNVNSVYIDGSIDVNASVDTKGWKTEVFQQADHGISIQIPKEWNFIKTSVGLSDGDTLFLVNPSQKDTTEGRYFNVSASFHKIEKKDSLSVWVTKFQEENSGKYTFTEPVIIQGDREISVLGLTKLPDQSSNSSRLWAFVVHNDRIYELGFDGSADSLKKMNGTILSILKSVQFIAPLPFVRIPRIEKTFAVPADEGYALSISWLQEPEELNMVDPMIESQKSSDGGTRFYYKVGQITNGRYKNNYLLNILVTGGLGSRSFCRVIYNPKEKTFVYLEKYSENLSYFTTPYIYDANSTIPDLIPPTGIAIPNSTTTLTAEVFEVNKWFSDYPLAAAQFTDSHAGTVYFDPSAKCYFIRMPDGTVKLYHLNPKFIKSLNERGSFYSSNSFVPSITWSDGTNNFKEYTFNEPTGGCGTNTCHAIFTEKELGGITALKEVGTTSTGSAVYEPKASNSNILKETYDNYFVPTEEEKIEYSSFIKTHPLFYWKDPLGHWVRFKQTMFLPAVECGKPVIYLYPTVTSAVNVRVVPSGGFSKSEPHYPNGGWNVIAHPSGQLDYGDGASYPYLFWEGKAMNYEIPKKGFVVSSGEIPAFLQRTLHSLGLNQEEAGDFMEYWVPRMQDRPYYFITFVDQDVFDAIAPLTVTPKPDSVIRIFMDYQGLDTPIAVEPLAITTPVRKGFTVIEWGGAIH